MNTCYLCGDKLNNKNISEEHIIPNALHGRLKSTALLCSKCNSQMGENIDAKFSKIFSCFTAPLHNVLASKDRGNNPPKAEGRVSLESGKELKVTFQQNKIVPNELYYEVINRDEIHFYFPSKEFPGYKNHIVEKLLKKNEVETEPDIKSFTEINNPDQADIFFSKGKPLFNEIFRKGLKKIAINYAVYNGIDRTELSEALNICGQKILTEGNIFPFVPLGALDSLIEPCRFEIENDYPSHTIILFTENYSDRRVLFCYIDLFSTFQYYVVLNGDYKGEEINEIYYQTLKKQIIPKIKIRGSSPKDLMIIAGDLGVDHRAFGGKSYEEIYSILEKAQKQRRPNYTRGINSFLKSASQVLYPVILLLKVNKAERLGDKYQKILDLIPKLNGEDFLSISQEFKRIDTVDVSSFYKQNFIEADGGMNLNTFSYPDKILEVKPDDYGQFKNYGFLKFTQLNIFANSN